MAAQTRSARITAAPTTALQVAVLAVALAALVAATAVAPAHAAAPTPRPEPVRVMLDWSPNTNHTGLYVALDKGWFAEQGLQVEILEPSEGAGTEAVVGAGRAQFGVSFQEYATHARLEGVPIVSIAAVLQHNTSGFASLKTTGIRRPKDFAGRRFGGYDLPIERAVVGSLIACDGGDRHQMQFVSVGTADVLTLLQRRDIDYGWIFYGWEGIEARLRGMDLNVVMMEDHFDCVPDYYTPILITGEQLIREKPDLVRRFMAATSRGYTWAGQHPDEAAEILSRRVPELDRRLVRESQRWLSPHYQADAPRWGEQKLEVWQRFSDWLYTNQLIDRPFDAAAAFTNQFLP